jgi:hypothetical protein
MTKKKPKIAKKIRSIFEPNDLLAAKATFRRTMQTQIGQGLRAHYQPARDLPHQMLALLLRLKE